MACLAQGPVLESFSSPINYIVLWGGGIKAAVHYLQSRPGKPNQRKGKAKSSWISPIFVNSGVFSWESKHDSHQTFVPVCPREKFMNWPLFGLVCRGDSWTKQLHLGPSKTSATSLSEKSHCEPPVAIMAPKFLETCFQVLETSFRAKICTNFPRICANFPKICTNFPKICANFLKIFFKEYCYEIFEQFSDLWHTPLTGGLQWY